jgi:DNA polymerase III subunit delta
MIVRARDADRFVARPPAQLVGALLFGPDQGLVRERARLLAQTVVADLFDPFRVAELEEVTLESDPVRIWDEAAALSMTGGRRVVRVRGAGNALAGDFERFLAEPVGDALIVVEAGDLAKSASLRRVFEEADNAAAIGCYLDSAEDLESLVRAQLKAEGLSIDADALGYAVERLGSDRGVTRLEVEKLALYAMGDAAVTRTHVDAVLGDESELRTDTALDAAGEGDFVQLDKELTRLFAAGTAPVGLLRQALGHFQRLLMLRAQIDEGADLASSLKKLRPPLHFSRESSFRGQLQRWTRPRLEEALDLIYEGEAMAKTTAVPAEAVSSRALFSVAALAKAAR